MPSEARAPRALIAGDTCTFTVPAFSDTTHALIAPSSGWSILYRLVGSPVLEVDGATDGDGWTVTLPASGTDSLAAGEALAFVIASHPDGRRLTRQQPTVRVAANPATLGSGSSVTWAARTLAVVEHVLQNGVLPSGMSSYMVGDQQVIALSIDKLMALRNQLRAEVQTERAGGKMPRLAVRFAR
jgi:hypothetical protein